MFLNWMHEYFGIIIMFFLSGVIGLILFFLSYFLAPKNYDMEKLSVYECGFEPYGLIRIPFDIQFYLIAILFLIFDLEIAFLFPWIVSVGQLEPIGFWSVFIFLLFLTLGFIYEWRTGALIWN